MIDPARTVLFFPPGLVDFKQRLFSRVGKKMGHVTHSLHRLGELPRDLIPVIGCSPQLTPLVKRWVKDKRDFIYWDRGYFRRVFATWTPRGENGGYYRWHLNSFQALTLREDADPSRWNGLGIKQHEWRKGGSKIIVAAPSPTYQAFHEIAGWTERTIEELRKYTDRPLVIREKTSEVPLGADLRDAHALVTHGSNAAVESVYLGTPVFVDKCSAAALVGLTDLAYIESPIYPDRERWYHTLAFDQFNEAELTDGTLWRLIR